MISTKIRCVKLTRTFHFHCDKEKPVLGKVILWISAIVFIPYGLLCLLNPELPAGYAGLTMGSGDAFVEIGAMYGGLQTGFGLFCLLGALREDFFRPALTALLLIVGGLALARLYSTLTSAVPVSGYTWAAMAYEFTTAALAGLALRKS
jgi:Domain of unknown function (DUF4345)